MEAEIIMAPPIAAAAITALATAGTTAYSVNRSNKAANKAAKKAASNIPEPTKPEAMPVQDDEAARRERLRAIASLSNTSGRASTFLTGSRLGDDTAAPGRGGMAMG